MKYMNTICIRTSAYDIKYGLLGTCRIKCLIYEEKKSITVLVVTQKRKKKIIIFDRAI